MSNKVKKFLITTELLDEYVSRLGLGNRTELTFGDKGRARLIDVLRKLEAFEEPLPEDAVIQDVARDETPDCLKILVSSESYPILEAGDLFHYAPLLIPIGVSQEKAEQVFAELTGRKDKGKQE